MASSQKLISILFLLTIFSMQIHAREFFSKIPSVNNNNEKQTTTIYGGLYDHESGQLPPSTTTATKETYEPYVTPVKYHPDEPYNSIPTSRNNKNVYKIKETYEPYVTPVKYHPDEPYNSIPASRNNNVYKIKETYEPYVTPVKYHPDEPYNSIPTASHNKNGYEISAEQQNLGEAAMFTERGWSTKENRNNNGYNNGEKQGMSDTRYLENGRYYHDVKNENNYYPNQFESSNGVASRNEFNENRYSNQDEFEP